MTHHIPITLAWIIFSLIFPLTMMFPKGRKRLSSLLFNTAALILQTEHRVGGAG